jgi:gliding motility-associated-like protein
MFPGIDTISYMFSSSNGCNSKTTSILKIKNCVPPLEIVEKINKPFLQLDGSYNVRISILVKNSSSYNFDSVQLNNDLKNTFISPTSFKIKSFNAFGNLLANSSYDGVNDKNLLTYKSKVMALQKDSLEIVVNFNPNGFVGNLFNQTDLSALSPFGWVKNSSSNLDELNGNITAAPSKLVIEEIGIFVPDAFSPNGDGVNDYFQIGHPSNTKVVLNVYNRWGVLVYANDNYANDWYGNGVGSFLGKKLLDGTYYYNVTIRYTNAALNKKLAGFITLKR